MAYGEFAKIYDELINEDINYNEMVDVILKVCNENNIKFRDYLNDHGIVATIRRELGSDIDAACGQLRAKEMLGD